MGPKAYLGVGPQLWASKATQRIARVRVQTKAGRFAERFLAPAPQTQRIRDLHIVFQRVVDVGIQCCTGHGERV